jgi:RNA polymerase subunit RPABC4/transcription elongation factor Spt4
MIIRYCTKCKIDPQELFKDRMTCPICGGKKTGFFNVLPIEHSDVDEAIINLSIYNAIFGTEDDE